MTKKVMSWVAAVLAGLLSTSPSLAQSSAVDLIIELGVGGRIQPEYEGSEDYEVTPLPIINLGYLNIPGLLEIGSISPQGGGLSFGPSFNYISARDFDGDTQLNGLDDVDATYEAGLRVSYEWQHAEVWGATRYAFGGADGFVGDLGANAIARPNERLELKIGPVATLASSSYAETYFGVSERQSALTGVEAFDPEGGFKSVGIQAGVRYEFKPDWFLRADAGYSKLVGDFASSPIVKAGDDDQLWFGLGLSRRFAIDLF